MKQQERDSRMLTTDFINNLLFVACVTKTVHRVSDFLYDQDVYIQYNESCTLLHISCALCFKEGVDVLLSVFADNAMTAEDEKHQLARQSIIMIIMIL